MKLKNFLGIAFMCHQKPERSFFIGNRQLPLCARCTGTLIGYFAGIFIAVVTCCENYLLFLPLLLPMIIDGTIQQYLRIESNNIRRLITGILGGIGIIYVFISIHMFTVWLAKIFVFGVIKI